jgi:hypothetical protein
MPMRGKEGSKDPKMLDIFDFYKMFLIFVLRGFNSQREFVTYAVLFCFHPQM